ncbi:MAG: VTT domain-containing protein [Vicinamibacterales bacterium]
MRWLALTLAVLALILVPFFLFEDQFNALAARLASGEASTWYSAVAIAALLGSDVVLPIPSSLVSAAAGVLLGFWRAVGVIWIGMTISCLIGYWIGARSAGATRRFVGPDSLAKAATLANRYGDLTIVLARPVPVLAEASVIFAGVVKTPFARFVALTSWANLGIALGYAAIGAFSMKVESFLLAFLGAMALPGIAGLVARLWFRRTRQGHAAGQRTTDREQ